MKDQKRLQQIQKEAKTKAYGLSLAGVEQEKIRFLLSQLESAKKREEEVLALAAAANGSVIELAYEATVRAVAAEGALKHTKARLKMAEELVFNQLGAKALCDLQDEAERRAKEEKS